MTWKGVRVVKYASDLWAMQEIIYKVKPKLIIETGTRFGASANFFADMQILAKIEWPRVYTVDVSSEEFQKDAEHTNVKRFIGSSLDPDIFAEIQMESITTDPVLVNLDSDHTAEHVAKELALYAPLVTVGSYLIVEDTNQPGPRMALYGFLAGHPEFMVDRRVEPSETTNPCGYLLRCNL
jgi:cephalosporin hydroxylase